MSQVTYEQLREAVDGGAVAIRSSLTLASAGGPGSKVMPPTFGVADSAEHKYAVENRIVAGNQISKTVLLDSVASQANRMEEALLDGWDLGELDFPVALVDFADCDDLEDLGRLTSLEAPHRLADAIFRDCLLEGTLFRLSTVGRAVSNATPKNAAALLHYSPHALLFGMWDSTGPKGGLGSKFQRAIVSEIVGFDAELGAAVGSRIDPFDIRKGATGILPSSNADEVWTFDKGSARKGKEMRPSEINHGNIMPSIDGRAGGVTISEARQTVVLSLPALRKLRFPQTVEGVALDGSTRRDAESAARTAVAALGLAALTYQQELDFDLRSRCLLIPTHAPRVELVGRNGETPQVIELNREAAQAILAQAASEAASFGLGFGEREIQLEPAPKLLELLRRSRRLATKEQPVAG